MSLTKTQAKIQVNPEHLKNATEITAVCRDFRSHLERNGDDFGQMFLTASAIQQIRQLFTKEMLKEVRKLENTKLGYMTDRKPGTKDKFNKEVEPYPDDVVRDVLIEAGIRGFRWHGNEINIIAGNFYATKEGLKRKIRETSGISQYRETIEPFRFSGGERCEVTASATWQLNAKSNKTRATFSIRVNRGMGDDAIKGKAESKLRRAVLFILGEPELDIPDPEAIDVDTEEAPDTDDGYKEFAGAEISEQDAITDMMRQLTKLMNEEHVSVIDLREACAGDGIPKIPIQLADTTREQLEHVLFNWSQIKDRIEIIRKERRG